MLFLGRVTATFFPTDAMPRSNCDTPCVDRGGELLHEVLSLLGRCSGLAQRPRSAGHATRGRSSGRSEAAVQGFVQVRNDLIDVCRGG